MQYWAKMKASLAATGCNWRLCQAGDGCIPRGALTQPTAAAPHTRTPLNFAALKESTDFCKRIRASNGRAHTRRARP
jgi:hypothetical protein